MNKQQNSCVRLHLNYQTSVILIKSLYSLQTAPHLSNIWITTRCDYIQGGGVFTLLIKQLIIYIY